VSESALVTGASGFTGMALCRRLVGEGVSVTAFVRPSSRSAELSALGVRVRTVDITSPGDVRANFDAFSTVYHIAAAFRTEENNLAAFRLVNVGATRNLLEAAEGKGVGRFVHCSTVGVQGGIDHPPASEDYRFGPGDEYQQSKMEGELLAREFFSSRRIEGAVVRPVGIYGPGDTRFLKLFRPISRRRFVMIGSGRPLYHLTYIDDLVDGIRLAASRPEAVGEVFTIGGPRYTSLNELVRLIADAVGVQAPRWRVPYAPVYAAAVTCQAVCRAARVSPPLYPRRVEFFAKSRAFSIDKARRLLGYDPKVDLEEGLGRTARWYRQNGLIS
jgi:nucleoside-diphosphate-sugar epimerase